MRKDAFCDDPMYKVLLVASRLVALTRAFVLVGQRARPLLPALRLVVDIPSCRYTAPAERRGWRGVAERGEDPDTWYDALGERSGPPRNYFVQSREERTHTAAFELVSTVLADVGAALPLITEFERVTNLVRQPLLNKKLFGDWAPLVLGGEIVASLAPTGGPPTELSCVVTTGDRLETPALLTLRRAGERVTVTNGYGTTDAHLQPDEAVRATLLATDDAQGAVSEAAFGALEGNARRLVPWQTAADPPPALAGGLALGTVSLLNEYLLVQRDEAGALADVWLRCDDAPLQLQQADLYSDPTRQGRRDLVGKQQGK